MTKRRRTTTFWKIMLWVVVGVLAAYILALITAWFALRWHWTEVQGSVDPHTDQFQALAEASRTLTSGPHLLPVVEDTAVVEQQRQERVIACSAQALAPVASANTRAIVLARATGATIATLNKMLFAIRLRLDHRPDVIQQFDTCALQPPDIGVFPSLDQLATTDIPNLFPWVNTEEWNIIQQAFTKDRDDILRAATASGADARLMVSIGFVEQLRLYFTQRELYEKFFKPLKILGNATKNAWGVMSIKETMAIQTENHLTDAGSPYYLGSTYARALDFTSDQPADERYARLTDEKHHYYSYLYAGLMLHEFSAQWQRAGFPIDDRPEILATLFNLGFNHSTPNDHPQVGGSSVTINAVDYTFGSLAFEFYYSGLLTDNFPYPAQ